MCNTDNSLACSFGVYYKALSKSFTMAFSTFSVMGAVTLSISPKGLLPVLAGCFWQTLQDWLLQQRLILLACSFLGKTTTYKELQAGETHALKQASSPIGNRLLTVARRLTQNIVMDMTLMYRVGNK